MRSGIEKGMASLLALLALAAPAAGRAAAAEAEVGFPPPDSLPVEEAETISPSAAEALRQSGDFFSLGELRLTLFIFVFGLISMGLFYMMHRSGKATPYTLRIFVIIILVFGTLLVVSSAYSTEQIAPVVGFFGTIAGYLVGRSDRPGGNGKGGDDE